jgi:hypothetical protein
MVIPFRLSSVAALPLRVKETQFGVNSSHLQSDQRGAAQQRRRELFEISNYSVQLSQIKVMLRGTGLNSRSFSRAKYVSRAQRRGAK